LRPSMPNFLVADDRLTYVESANPQSGPSSSAEVKNVNDYANWRCVWVLARRASLPATTAHVVIDRFNTCPAPRVAASAAVECLLLGSQKAFAHAEFLHFGPRADNPSV